MYVCLEMGVGNLSVVVRKLASPFGHLTQVRTQVQLVGSRNYL